MTRPVGRCWLALALLGAGCHAKSHGGADGAVLADAGSDATAAYELIDRFGEVCAPRAIAAGLRFLDVPLPCGTGDESCPPPIVCRRHSDCADAAHGRCEAELSRWCSDAHGAITSRRCNVDGECLENTGGSCVQLISNTHCEYDACEGDDECGRGEHCACSTPSKSCLPGDCGRDDDCAPGRRCLLSRDCFEQDLSYHCSSPDDECQGEGDCPERLAPCVFSAGHFRCLKACPDWI